MDNFKVIISSTRLDLIPFRKGLKDKLVELQQIPLGMEDWGSNPADAVTVSEEYVRECDVFVGVYAFRYGYAPQEGGPSVTEQEYDLARELGKRCLCYVADDSLRPATSDEEQWKLERLSQFKGRVDRELVRSVFTSPEDLKGKVGDDINRLLRGFPLGYVPADVKRRWREQEEVERSNLIAGLQEPPVTVSSPLVRVWQGFLSMKGWHERVAEDLNELAVKVEALRQGGFESPELSELVRKAKAVDTRRDYVALTNAVQPLVSKEAWDSVNRVVEGFKRERANEPSYKTARSQQLTRMIGLTYDVLGSVRSLNNKLEKRRYARILPVMGGMGSGKTHFLTTLMGEGRVTPSGSPVDYLLLPLERPAQGRKLEESILDRIRERTRMQWRSLTEFNDFLEDPAPHLKAYGEKTRLVVALDDFQKWLPKDGEDDGRLDALLKLATGKTDLHSLHWLIMLRDISYAEVADQAKRDQKNQWFWEQFSYEEMGEDAPMRVGVWFVLDQLNRDEEMGLNLIKESLESRPGDRAVIIEKTDENEHALQEFSSPFIARIVIGLLEKEKLPAASIVDLNFIEFVKEFWESRLARLDTSPLGGDARRAGRMLELATGLLARSLLKADTSPFYSDALDEMTASAPEFKSELKDRRKSEAALNILLDGNLLKWDFQDEPAGGLPVEKLSIQFETFWEWHMARALGAGEGKAGGDPQSALAESMGRLHALSSPQIREGVLIFLLLLLDQRAAEGRAEEQTLKALVRYALGSGDMPPSALWFAGPKCGPVLQRVLAEDAQEHERAFAGGHELFAYMYFIADCHPEVLDVPTRLRLLQPHFGAMHDYNLADYYLYIVERLFLNSDDEQLLEALTYLEGCEVLGVTQRLAEVALDNVYGEEAEEMDFVLRFLRKNLEHIRAEFERREKPENERRYFFWEWLVCIFCRYAAGRRELGAYWMLKENGWYDPQPEGLLPPVPLRLRQEANLALGFWYRRWANRSEKEQYHQLVNTLAASPGEIERETAFFFIRHTEAYERDKSVRVRDVFHPALEKLFLDPDMAELVEEYLQTFKDNLDDFEALDRRRPRNQKRAQPDRSPE
jgi:hypothetical protein